VSSSGHPEFVPASSQISQRDWGAIRELYAPEYRAEIRRLMALEVEESEEE
jgi:hypothetical protein